MKKNFILSIATIALFASCKKSSSSSSGYSMTATVAGTAKNFNIIPPVAQIDSSTGSTFISITGVLNATTGESMVIQLDNGNGGGPFVAGKYSDTSSLFDISATYTADVNDQYIAGSVVWGFASGASIPLTNHFLITITSIDKTAIKGTFSGDFFINADPTAAKKTVTNGAFNAQFQ